MPQVVALLVSIFIESIVAFPLVRVLGWGSGWRAALAAALGTLATHHVAWELILELEHRLGYAAAVALCEGAVVAAESAFYRLLVPLPWQRAVLASAVANSASTAAGLIYYALTG